MLIFKNYNSDSEQLHKSINYVTLISILVVLVIILLMLYLDYNLDIFYSILLIIPLTIIMYYRLNKTHLFELQDDYILSKNYFQTNWKKTSIDKVCYDEYYEKDNEYLNLYIGTSFLKINSEDTSQTNLINTIKNNIQHNSYYQKSWTYYLKNSILVFPFLVFLSINMKIVNIKSSLHQEAITKYGYVDFEGKVKDIEFLGRNTTARIKLFNHNPFSIETHTDSIRLKQIKKGDSIRISISPIDYEKKILKTKPFQWFDKYHGYSYIHIYKISKL